MKATLKTMLGVLLIMMMGSVSFAQEAWPLDPDWTHLIDVDWNSTQDPQDQSKNAGYTDIVADGSGHDAYFYSTSTSLFFRLALRSTPISKGSLRPFSWHVILDGDNDDIPDWDIVASGISEELFTEYNTNGSEDPSAGHPTFLIADPLNANYLRVIASPTSTYPDLVYLDFQVPFSSLQTAGYTPGITFETAMTISMATSNSNNVSNAADFVGNTATVSGALANSALLGGGSYGILYDTRDTAPYSSAGIWNSGETVTINGYGWPTSTSTYYNNGVLNGRVESASGAVMWTGTVALDNAGEFAANNTWTIPGGTPEGIYTFKIESPLEAGDWNSYDSFSVPASVAPPTIISTSLAANNANITTTFSEAVFNSSAGSGALETGDFTLSISGGSATLTSTTPSSISVSGNAYTLGLDLTGTPDGTEVLSVNPTTVDAIYNAQGAAATITQSNNTVALNDQLQPTLTKLSPTDAATEVLVGSNLVITFNEIVDVENGNITIKKTSDNSTIQTIDVSSGQVTGTGTAVITINPSSDLAGETEYYILIDATAFDDTSSNSFAGISISTDWRFTTGPSTAPVMAISSTVTAGPVQVEETVTYTISVQNTGVSDGMVTTITDTLPTGFSYLNTTTTGLSTSDPTINGQVLTWTGSWSVVSGTPSQLSFQVQTSAVAGLYSNSAEAQGSNFATISSGLTAPLTTVARQVSITLAASIDTTFINSNVNYMMTVTNTGLASISANTIVDTLPAGFTYQVGSAAGFTTSDPAIVGQELTWTGPWNINAASAGQNSISLTFTVAAGGTAGTFSSQAVVALDDNQTWASTGATADITLIQAPAGQPLISITNVASVDTISSGDTLSYTISILSAGPGNGSITGIQDALPAGFTYIPGTTSGLTTQDPIITDQTLSWDGAWTIQKGVGNTLTLSFDVRVSLVAGNYFSIAGVDGSDFTSASTGSSAAVRVLAPSLLLSKVVSTEQALPGDTLTYTLVYMNIGDDRAFEVQLTEAIHPRAAFIPGTASGNMVSLSYSHDDEQSYDANPVLPITHIKFLRSTLMEPGESGTVEFKVEVQ